MYKRKYSLKTRYNFKNVFKYGLSFDGKFFLVKYLKRKHTDDIVLPNVGIIVSGKFNKSKPIQNTVKRVISTSISNNINLFPNNWLFVFIPKKNILDNNGKISIDAKILDSEIDTFLSKMVVS